MKSPGTIRWFAANAWCGIALCSVIGVSGCSPKLDWRQVRLEGRHVRMLFPCRPDHFERSVTLVGAGVSMRMSSCSASGMTFALAAVEMPTPLAAANGLLELRTRSLANIRAVTPVSSAWQVSGMTPTPQAQRVFAAGRLPDGASIQEHAVFFAKGATIFQGSVIGAVPDPSAVDAFFESFELG